MRTTELHIIVPRDLKAWLKARAGKEEVDGSVSRYCRRVLQNHRAMIDAAGRDTSERNILLSTPTPEEQPS